MKILVTGAAGFIGYHLSRRLLDRGDSVVGVDNLNPYYDPDLKRARLGRLEGERFSFHRIDIEDRASIDDLFARERPDTVVHLAAQAGVRYSLTNPRVYIDSNVTGFLNVLEACRYHPVEHLVFASSSSVYGANTKMPFSIHDNVDHPVSLYAATKKSNELMAHTYSHLFGLRTTGLRFFTVYGPWGRPDMALFLFTKAILAGEPINVFNNGDMQRDFTYVDDIVEGVIRVVDRPAEADPNWDAADPDPGTSRAPYRLFNIGNDNPVPLMDFIRAIEDALGRKAILNLMPMQAGDVPVSWADVSDLASAVGFRPATPIEEGVRRFVEWYRDYYGDGGHSSG